MAPYKVVDRWTKEEVVSQEDGRTWAGTGYTERVIRYTVYEKREYYNPDNRQVYTEVVEVDSYTRSFKEGW